MRKVRLPWGGSQDPCGVPFCPQYCLLYPGGEGERGLGTQAAPRCRARIPSPCLSFPRHLVGSVELKSCRPRMLRVAEPARAGDRSGLRTSNAIRSHPPLIKYGETEAQVEETACLVCSHWSWVSNSGLSTLGAKSFEVERSFGKSLLPAS